MLIHLLFYFILVLGAYVYAEEGVVFVASEGTPRGWGFQGQLLPNSSVVIMTPEIRSSPIKSVSKSMSICGYTVHYDTVSFFPFIVLLIDQQRGLAEVRLKSNLPRESLNTLYTFQIEAYDCDVIPNFSERKFVLVEIKTYLKPIFKLSFYHFSVKVNSPIGSKVGTITAYERPERTKLGICKYKIVSRSEVPFNINDSGTLTTKVLTLNNKKSIKYVFKVEASDCQKPKPKVSSVPVMVAVYDDCNSHWTGLPTNVDYDGKKGVLLLLPYNLVKPSLHLCSANCQTLQASITIKLQGKDIRPANSSICKQDRRSLKRQEALCDISKKGVDILKMASQLMKDEANGGYYFNVHTAIKVNSNSYNFGHFLSRKFTIMFWMKHGGMQVNGFKEQILCNSDGQAHNRHHFSLFLHNCKLILLFRKEFGEASQNQYEPTEWRFGPLQEVCDNKWHHYAVLFNDGELFVHVDGEVAQTRSQHLEDKPLLDSPPDKNMTRLTVGACFHAKSHKFVQYFKGYLASLKVDDGHLEAVNNIRCIATCGEALLLPHLMDVIDFQSSVTLLSNSVVIRSEDIFSLLRIFSGISYINTELLNEVHVGEVINRNITIDADINCDRTPILKPPQRTIILHLKNVGFNKIVTKSLSVHVHHTVQGYQNERIPIFQNVKIIQALDKEIVDEIKSCIVSPTRKLLESWEYLDWPTASVINFHLSGLNNSHGLVLEGLQMIKIYEIILANIYYVTRKYDAAHPERRFAVACSYLKNVTDKVYVNIKLRQNDLKTYYIVDDPDQNQNDQSEVVRQQGKESKVGFEEKEIHFVPKVLKKSVIGNIALWVILVCLFVVVVVAIMGFLIFYKRSKRQSNYNSPRITWFNMDKRSRLSKIKVTTNPLHNEGAIIEEEEQEDDQSMTKEAPESEEDYVDEGEDYEEEDYTEKMIRNVFPRIPHVSSTQSVDV